MRSAILMACGLLSNPGGGSGVTLIPAPIGGLTSIAYDGQYIWTGVKDGFGSNESNHLISKVDRSLAVPGVVATVDISDYAEGGLGTPGYDVSVRQIRSDGTHVFACLLCSKDTVANEHSGFLLIIDKTTNAVVGHCRFTGSVVGNPYRPFNCRSVCFDGAGNLYVAQTPTNGGAPTYPTILHKFVIADVIAAYPTYGTPALSKTTTHPYLEGVAFGAGYTWGVHGPGSSGFLTRFDPATLDETEFSSGAFRGHLVTYALGYIWVGGSNGYSSTAEPLLRFDPATFPSASVAVTTPVPMDVSGGMTISTDGTYLWFGGYASNTELWRFSVSAGSVDLLSTVALGSDRHPLDLAYDGTSMWMVSRQSSKLVRISAGVGNEAVDYTLADGGPPIPHAPILSFITPANGPASGGTSVYIYTDDSTGATGASIGGVPLTSFSIYNANYVQGVTGAHASGSVDVTVTNAAGTSDPLVGGYTYNAPAVAVVYAISPIAGLIAGGTVVQVTVDSSVGATGASVGGIALTSFSILNSGTVQGTTGAHAAGAVNIVVTNAVGDSLPLSGGFTYGSVPVLSAVSPSVGSNAGGTTVVFTVDDSSTIQAAYLGTDALSSFTIVDPTHVSGVTPAHANGLVGARVLNNAFFSNTLSNAFQYGDVPVISFLSPETVGPTTGGTTTNIYGSGFTGATAVKFGGVNVQSFTVAADSYMPVVTPAHAQGVVDVEIVGASGLSGFKVNAFTYPAPVQPVITSLAYGHQFVGAAGDLDNNFGSPLERFLGVQHGYAIGSGFLYASDVKVDGASVSFVVDSDTALTFVSPGHVRGPRSLSITTDGLTASMNPAYTSFIPLHGSNVSGHFSHTASGGDGFLWINGFYGQSPGISGIQKMDTTLSPPEVVAVADTSLYTRDDSSQVHPIIKSVRAFGNYVFACFSAVPVTGMGDYSYCLVIDKTTCAIVGHVRFAGGSYYSAAQDATSDGSGNFFVLTNGLDAGQVGTSYVYKFNIAAVIAAYTVGQAYGTPVWTAAIPTAGGAGTQISASLTGQIVYLANAVWIAGYHTMIRFDASTGTSTQYITYRRNTTLHQQLSNSDQISSLHVGFGSLWVSGLALNYPTTAFLQRFDPGTIGGGPQDVDEGLPADYYYPGSPAQPTYYHTGTYLYAVDPISEIPAPSPNPNGRLALGFEGSTLWVGMENFDRTYKYSNGIGTEAPIATLGPYNRFNDACEFAWDGSNMWIKHLSTYISRVTGSLGSETVNLTLQEYGPFYYT